MAAFTSKATGNWSASGQTTWNEVGVPGDGDTVTIGAGHTITVDVNTTVGDSPAVPANVITATTTGALTVASGVTFTIKGCVNMEDGNWTMNAGSIVEFQVPSATRYWFRTGKAHSDTCKIVINGTSGNRCAFRSSSGAGIAYIDSQGFFGNARLNAEYCDFTLIGDATEDFAEPYCNTTGNDFYMRYCTLTSCGNLNPHTIDTNASFEILNCIWTTTVGSKPLEILLSVAPAGGKTRSIIGCSFDKQCDFFTPVGLTITNCYFANSYSQTDTSTGWTLFQYNFVRKQSQPATRVQGDISDCYFYKDSLSNPHFLIPTVARNVAISGIVFEHGGTDTNGDCVTADSPSSARVYSMSNCLIIPNSNGGVSGTCISLLGNANNTWSVDHNTYISTSGSAIAIAETYTGHAGMLASARSNLAWNPTSNTAVIIQDSGTNDAVSNYITAAGYNGVWNGTSPLYDFGAGVLNTDSTANDVSGNPQFVDRTRNLATWDASLGGAGTTAAALTRIAADPYLIDDLVTWVKAGFKVRNSAFKDAGHDGVTIGAMGYQGGGVLLPNASYFGSRL